MHSFEFTGETKVNFHGVTVHRIRATRDIPRAGVKKGDEGGWVESVELPNGNAQVYGDARVSGNAWVSGLSGKNNAKDFAERGHGKFVDTTPKPKIPEDAEFITWTDPSTRDAQVASRYGNPKNRFWKMRGGLLNEKELLKHWIGDAEVTVLVPRLQSDVE